MKTIIIDIDDVSLEFDNAFVQYMRKQHFVLWNPEHIEYGKSFSIGDELASNLVDQFYGSEDFKNLVPVKGASEAIAKLSNDFRCVHITYRPAWTRKITEEQIGSYFPAIDSVFFANGFNNHDNPSKLEYAVKLSAVDVIDDNHHLCGQVRSEGIKATVFPMRWNSHVCGRKDWYQIMEDYSLERNL